MIEDRCSFWQVVRCEICNISFSPMFVLQPPHIPSLASFFELLQKLKHVKIERERIKTSKMSEGEKKLRNWHSASMSQLCASLLSGKIIHPEKEFSTIGAQIGFATVDTKTANPWVASQKYIFFSFDIWISSRLICSDCLSDFESLEGSSYETCLLSFSDWISKDYRALTRR